MVTYQDRISTDTPLTNEWLELVGPLKEQSQTRIQSVLEEILENHHSVVVKIKASNSIFKDYKILQQLHDIPGFIRPHCYFECEETDPDTSTKVLIMPFLEEGSMRSIEWAKKPTAVLHACLMQCMCSLFQAYEEKRIIHDDTHLDNVLLKKTTMSEVVYTIGGNAIHIPTEGYLIEIMDFEVGGVPITPEGAAKYVYNDILHAIFDLVYNNRTMKLVEYDELMMTLRELESNPVDVYTGWQILKPLVLKLYAIPKVIPPYVYKKYTPAV